MEPEGSLPHSQVPATCPYPEPARSSPYLHILLPEDPFYYYPLIYAWVSQAVSFPQLSPPTPLLSTSPPYVLHALPISFFSILSPEQYWVRSNKVVNFSMIVASFLTNPHSHNAVSTCRFWPAACPLLINAMRCLANCYDLKAQKRISLSGAKSHKCNTRTQPVPRGGAHTCDIMTPH